MTNKKLVRVKGGGHRWKKGHSCVSNAPNNKFRDEVKGRFFQKLEGDSGLTTQALIDHNQVLDQVESQLTDLKVDDEDMQSGGKTFNTFATNFSQCTLPAFNTFFLKFKQDSDQHKRMLAIHAVVQEYMTEENIPEDYSSYCAALTVTARGMIDSEEDVEATLALFGKVIRKVPVDLLRKRFDEFDSLFTLITHTYKDSDNQRLLAYLIGCLSVFLRAQELSRWKSANSKLSSHLESLLNFIIDERHKIRKSAQHNISAILRASSFMIEDEDTEEEMEDDSEPKSKPFITHPGTEIVTTFVESHLCSPNDVGKRKQTLHLLVILRQIIMVFPKRQLKKICEWILSMMQLGDVLVNVSSLQALYSLFKNDPPPNVLNAKTNIALINALISHQGAVTASGVALVIVPNMNEKENCRVWIAVVTAALANLFKLDEDVAFEKFSHWFKLLVTYWKSEHEEVHTQVSESFELILEECIGKMGERMKSEPFYSRIKVIFNNVESGLSLQYQSAWESVFTTLGTCFIQFGSFVPELLKNCLKNLIELLNISENKKSLEHAIGLGIKGMGPEAIIEIIPVQVTGNFAADEKYLWVLPLLRKYVTKASLKFFISYFYPLANKCHIILQAEASKGNEKMLLYKMYEKVELQIWAMLPSFALNAIDMEEALSEKKFAPHLADHLKLRNDTRLDILLTIRNLVNSTDGKSSILQVYSKNFIPVLFNIYRGKAITISNPDGIPNGHRLAAFETIRTYLEITSSDKCNEFLNMIITKFEDKDGEGRETLLDLARLFLPYVGATLIVSVYTKILDELNRSSNKSLHKSTYKLLEEILVLFQKSDKDVSHNYIAEIAQTLSKTLATTPSNCRAPRLRCLKLLFASLSPDANKEEWIAFIKQSTGEIIMCCGPKQSIATRKAAFILLSEIGATYQKLDKCTGEETIQFCLSLLLAGLKGTPSLVANTILAITSFAFQYKDLLSSNITKQLLDAVLLCVQSNCNEVIASCLSFIKSSLSIFHPILISDYVDKIVLSLCNMEEASARKFRMKTRYIFSKLIRKFGADRITSLIPSDNVTIQKRIKALRKVEARKKRNKADDGSDSDSDDDAITKALPTTMDEILHELESDDDDDMETGDKSSKKSKQKKTKPKKEKKAWIKEDPDDIVDFLDSSTSQKVLSKQPQSTPKEAPTSTTSKTTKKEAFPVDEATGKIIIMEGKNKMKNEEMSVDDYDNYMNLRTGALQGKIKKRKRTLSIDSGSGEDDIKAAKKIITQPAKESSKKRKTSEFGVEYKAKKAKGDVKIKGKPDPYAYVPLAKERLNRRKSAKYAGQLKTLVKGAKRGASKGLKIKSKRRK